MLLLFATKISCKSAKPTQLQLNIVATAIFCGRKDHTPRYAGFILCRGGILPPAVFILEIAKQIENATHTDD
jgi:hypothetical protein